jgi:hypothetical protein
MTPRRLCKKIWELSQCLQQDDLLVITSIYSKTWTLVVLTNDKLATPTRAALGRLWDLFHALDRKRQERLVESQTAKETS